MSQKKTLSKYTKYVMWGTVALIPPAAFFYLLEFYTHNPFAEVRPWAQLFNIVLFELLAGIFLCITGRLRTAYRIEGTAALVFGLANAYVVRFRTNPLVPWDILSWRTAVSVSGNYDFTPDTRMIVVTILFLALIIGLQPVKFKIGRPGFFKRCLPGVVLGAVLVMFAGTLQQENFQNEHRLYNKLFTPVFMTQVDGIPVTFVMNLAYMSIEKPQKYSVGEAKEFLKKELAEIEKNAKIPFCENTLINAVLSEYRTKAEQEGLEFSARIQMPKELACDEAEFCVMLSNLLENSLDAAKSYIAISIKHLNHQLSLNVKNDYEGGLKKSAENNYLTTKPQGSGLGLKSVEAILKSNSGFLKIEDTDGVFDVFATLKN